MFDIKNKCNYCGSILIITDRQVGEIVCQKCGYVISEKTVAEGPELRQQIDKKSLSRTGSTTSIFKHDLSTKIDSANHDSMGKPFSISAKIAMDRLRTWNNRSKYSDNKDRTVEKAFSFLQIIKDKLSLPEVIVERAAYYYKKAINNNLQRGRPITALMAASVYAACRDSNINRTLRDIIAAADIRYKDLAKSYRLLVNELDLKMPLADSGYCISRIASRAGLPEKITRQAREVIKKAEQKKIVSGKHPMGLAAAALYFICVKNEADVTQKEIANAAEVSEVTIRNRLKGLRPVIQV